LLPIYQAAGIEYGVRWEVPAGINEIETDYGRNLNVSSAGALGWMQFMPSTWKRYGVDANHHGKKDPFNPVDAIFAAARYLKGRGGRDRRAQDNLRLQPRRLVRRLGGGEGHLRRPPQAPRQRAVRPRRRRGHRDPGRPGHQGRHHAAPRPVRAAPRRSGAIDRRVLATLEFLSASGLKPTVSNLECGHDLMTVSGNVSEHSGGDAVDIAAINGIPILGHQGPGSITDMTIRRLLTLQGTMKPHQIISLMTFDGADNTLSLPDHNDHIHIGFREQATAAAATPSAWSHLMRRLGNIDNPTVSLDPSRYAVDVPPRTAADELLHRWRAWRRVVP
jgi:hypothetical protein